MYEMKEGSALERGWHKLLSNLFSLALTGVLMLYRKVGIMQIFSLTRSDKKAVSIASGGKK